MTIQSVLSSLIYTAIFSLLLGSWSPKADCAGKEWRNIKIDGTTALTAFLRETLNKFSADNKIGISFGDHGVNEGLKCVTEKTCQIAITNDLTSEQEKMFVRVLLGHSAKAIKVTPDVKIDNITTDQIRSIFTGQFKNWQDIGGPNLPIIVWHRSPHIGVRTAFDEHFKLKDIKQVQEISIGPRIEMINRLKFRQGEKGVITFELAGMTDTQGLLKELRIDGVEPTRDMVKNGKYRFSSQFNLVLNQEDAKDPTIKKIIQIILDNRKGHFEKMGIVY